MSTAKTNCAVTSTTRGIHLDSLLQKPIASTVGRLRVCDLNNLRAAPNSKEFGRPLREALHCSSANGQAQVSSLSSTAALQKALGYSSIQQPQKVPVTGEIQIAPSTLLNCSTSGRLFVPSKTDLQSVQSIPPATHTDWAFGSYPSCQRDQIPGLHPLPSSKKGEGRNGSRLTSIGISVYSIGPGLYHSSLVAGPYEWHFWEELGVQKLPRFPITDVLRHKKSNADTAEPSKLVSITHIPLYTNITVGTSNKGAEEIAQICRKLAKTTYTKSSYDLLLNNCNHFVECMLERLMFPGTMPSWINRPAYLASSICSRVPSLRRAVDFVFGRRLEDARMDESKLVHWPERNSAVNRRFSESSTTKLSTTLHIPKSPSIANVYSSTLPVICTSTTPTTIASNRITCNTARTNSNTIFISNKNTSPNNDIRNGEISHRTKIAVESQLPLSDSDGKSNRRSSLSDEFVQNALIRHIIKTRQDAMSVLLDSRPGRNFSLKNDSNDPPPIPRPGRSGVRLLIEQPTR